MAKDCGCPACNPVNQRNFEYIAPRKLTLKERIHKQRMENHAACDRAYEYAMREYGDTGKAVVCDDEMDKKWLIVPKGQVTFHAEGNDIKGSNYFSRRIHWPGNEISGVTIGRGYDCGNRSQKEILSDLTAAGVSTDIAKLISESAGLKGESANLFVRNKRTEIEDITRKDQHNLFVLIYPTYEARAKANYEKWTGHREGKVEWLELDSKIRDILVDFVYQGFTKGPKPMTKGMTNDKQILIDYIEGSSVLSSYEAGRQRANYLRKNE